MSKVFGGLPDSNFRAATPAERAHLYADWIYLRQVHQSVCYDYVISMLRRKMTDPKRMSMGSLYWQLNDVWQGASWSSVDYELRWKPVHYALKRVYAPVQVQAYIPPNDQANAVVEVVYDESGPLPSPLNLKIFLQPISAKGSDTCAKALPVGSVTVKAGSRAGVPEWSMNIDQLMALKPGCTRETCFLRVEATEVGSRAALRKNAVRARRGKASVLGVKEGESQEALLWFTKFHQLALPEVVLRPHSFKQVNDRQVEFTVSATGGAAVEAFWDAQPNGHFSQNSVTVRPCDPVHVQFYSVNDVTAAELEKTLTIWTINGAMANKQKGTRSVGYDEGKSTGKITKLARRLSWW